MNIEHLTNTIEKLNKEKDILSDDNVQKENTVAIAQSKAAHYMNQIDSCKKSIEDLKD